MLIFLIAEQIKNADEFVGVFLHFIEEIYLALAFTYWCFSNRSRLIS